MTTHQPKARPILFTGASVRGILSGFKDRTRRPVKAPRGVSLVNARSMAGEYLLCNLKHDIGIEELHCPHGAPGDQLWVRETWANHFGQLLYRADQEPGSYYADAKGWRPSIHMPRALSRITLDIVEVRAERLQIISEVECEAELGLAPHSLGNEAYPRFKALWDSLYGTTEAAWTNDPWVWVIAWKPLTQKEVD